MNEQVWRFDGFTGLAAVAEELIRLQDDLAAAHTRIAELEAHIPFNRAARVFCAKSLDTDVDMRELRVAERNLIDLYRSTVPDEPAQEAA